MATAINFNGESPQWATLRSTHFAQPRAGFSPASQVSLQLRAAIEGTGSYLPERVLDNAELEKMVDTNNQWIMERTGIRERRIAADHETTATMAVAAGKLACADAEIDPGELDLIILATITPDQFVPAASCFVQHALGAKLRCRVRSGGRVQRISVCFHRGHRHDRLGHVPARAGDRV